MPKKSKIQISKQLLSWYDSNKASMPWRDDPNTYHIWLSEIMLQQTQVKIVIPYYYKWLQLFPTIYDVATADEQDILKAWEGLGYYSRAINFLDACKTIVNDYNGNIPTNQEDFLKLKGVGPYIDAAVRSIAYNDVVPTIDGNVNRVIARFLCLDRPVNKEQIKIHNFLMDCIDKARPGDFNQALMDLGRNICKPKNPICNECPISSFCESFKEGKTESIPVKAPKKPKPIRKGFVYFVKNNDNKILMERRPDEGLLGGLLAFPSSDWLENEPDLIFPIEAEWSQPFDKIMHEFTHFKLELKLVVGMVSKFHIKKSNYEVFDLYSFDESQLPTLMRKVLRKGKKLANQKMYPLRV